MGEEIKALLDLIEANAKLLKMELRGERQWNSFHSERLNSIGDAYKRLTVLSQDAQRYGL